MRYAVAFCALFWIWASIELSRVFPGTHALTALEIAQSN